MNTSWNACKNRLGFVGLGFKVAGLVYGLGVFSIRFLGSGCLGTLVLITCCETIDLEPNVSIYY